METHDVPCWMTVPMLANGVRESDYYLYGAGRALGFMKMAADALAKLDSAQKEAEYHTYAGISAARTAIDAGACWLNLLLQIGQPFNPSLDLSKQGFRKKLVKNRPAICAYVEALGALGKVVDEQRHKAQHRAGLPVKYHVESNKSNHQGGWYLVTQESHGHHQSDLHLSNLLQDWERQIEEKLFLIHHELVCPTLNDDEAEGVKEIKRTMKSTNMWTVPSKTSCPYHS